MDVKADLMSIVFADGTSEVVPWPSPGTESFAPPLTYASRAQEELLEHLVAPVPNTRR